MPTVIAVSNHKGGVGKTTSTVNIGAALASAGARVLLLDLDPQANLSLSLRADGDRPDIYQALVGQSALEPQVIRPGYELVPASLDLSGGRA